MTPEEADERIILSRQTLHRYRAMMDSGIVPHADIGLMEGEIALLIDIAQAHDSKADKIASLIGHWRDLMEKVRTVH
jgi:hypothetical protein